jgi:hypothetical protein
MAPPRQPAPEDLLGPPHGVEAAAHRIDVGGVEEGDPARGGAVEDGHRGGLVALQAEGHGAEADPRDLQSRAAEANVAHPRYRFGPRPMG